MNIEEKKAEAKRLSDEYHIRDAVDLYREIAEEEPNWGNYYAFLAANNVDAYLTNGIGNLQGAIKIAEETIGITIRLSENEELMEKCGSEIIGLYAKACKIKGQSLFENNMTDSACLEFLQEAIDYGENEANYYAGLFYVQNSPDNPSYNFDLFKDYTSKAKAYLEAYLSNLSGNEDPERISVVEGFLASVAEMEEPKKKKGIFGLF